MPESVLKVFAAGLIVLLCSLNACRAANPLESGITLRNCQLAAAYSAKSRGVSMLVMQNGKLIFEDYPNGHSSGEAHELASGTKSFSGVAALAAQEDGILSLDEKVSQSISEWKGDPRRENITIRELLSLVSGIDSKAGRPPIYADALLAEVTATPGQRFQYGPAPFQVFGELMRRKLKKTKENMVDYLTRRILLPADIHVAVWRKGADGMPFIPQGAALTATEWAKFGELIRKGGKIGDKQIIQAEALKTLFTGTQANPMYGLTWWLNRQIDETLRQNIKQLTMASDLRYGTHGLPDDLVMAAGAGKQRLYIVPSQNLIVVRQADGIMEAMLAHDQTGFSDIAFWQLLEEGKTDQAVIRQSRQAAAQNGATRRGAILRQFDSNKDGVLDQQEKQNLQQFLIKRRGANTTP